MRRRSNMNVESPDLAGRIRAGDPEAQRVVVGAYLPQILRAARAAGLGSAAAEDVAQATFLTFFKKAATFEGRSRVRTWLFGILYRKIQEARRKGRRETPTGEIEAIVDRRFDERGGWANPPREIEKALEVAELREAIETCLEGVPTQQRMAFVLREVEELVSQEICKILDVTRTNLGVLIFRARNRLRECLEARGLSR
jgi:RNA polymerase sigma-70 factor (ECF subfamily)